MKKKSFMPLSGGEASLIDLASLWGRSRQFIEKLQENEFGWKAVENSIGTFVARSVGMALSFLVQIVLARLLGSQYYGDYAYVVTWATTLIFLGRFGFDIASVKYIADYKAHRKMGLLKGFLSRSTRIVAVFSAGVAVSGISFILVLHSAGGISDNLSHLFLLSSVLFIFVSMLSAQNGMLRGDGKPVLALILQYVVYPLLIIVFVSSYSIVRDHLSPPVALSCNICAAILVVFLQRFFIRRSLRSALDGKTSRFSTREWFVTAFSMAVVSGSQLILNRSGTLVVGTIVGTEFAGVYSVANRVLQIVRLGVLVTNIASAHLLSQLHSTNNRRELQRLVSLVAKLGLFSTLPVVIGLFIWGDFVLSVFGETFVGGLSILRILLIGEVVNLITGPTNILMNMADCHRALAIILVLTVFANFFLIFILLGIGYGAQGVAVATILTIGISNMISAFYVRRKIGVTTSPLLS